MTPDPGDAELSGRAQEFIAHTLDGYTDLFTTPVDHRIAVSMAASIVLTVALDSTGTYCGGSKSLQAYEMLAKASAID